MYMISSPEGDLPLPGRFKGREQASKEQESKRAREQESTMGRQLYIYRAVYLIEDVVCM